ncbi:MAG TPA: hypothetical protein VHT68_22105 [Pseudolabrys sp.]|jgi:hypothetical protein|nr:hypothetical protein [Pseudolabrys sp.]
MDTVVAITIGAIVLDPSHLRWRTILLAIFFYEFICFWNFGVKM